MDPNISAQRVARELGLSARYVHSLLEQTGMRFAEHILELRLQRAKVMLDDAQFDALRIAEIARQCGLKDPAYFTRSFRKRFGRTPTSVRSRNLSKPISMRIA